MSPADIELVLIVAALWTRSVEKTFKRQAKLDLQHSQI